MEFSDFRNLKFSVFGNNCKISGQMFLSGPVTIASIVEGKIEMDDESRITIERNAKFTGTLNGFDVEIFGQFEGDLNAKGKLIIRSSAHVKGNINAQKICIYPGAYLEMEAHTSEVKL